jgi:hypothetical protein
MTLRMPHRTPKGKLRRKWHSMTSLPPEYWRKKLRRSGGPSRLHFVRR